MIIKVKTLVFCKKKKLYEFGDVHVMDFRINHELS